MRIKINTRFWAWACLFSVIPSVIWRVVMIAGVDTGFAEAARYRTRTGMSYILGLETLQLGGALLCVGLAHGWTRRFPRKLVLGVGGAADVLLYAILGVLAIRLIGNAADWFESWTPYAAMNALQTSVLFVCYIPLFFWPVFLTAALVGHARGR